jgi:hypothetical protein
MVSIFRRSLRTIQQAAAKTRALPGDTCRLLFYSHGAIIALAGETRKYLSLCLMIRPQNRFQTNVMLEVYVYTVSLIQVNLFRLYKIALISPLDEQY